MWNIFIRKGPALLIIAVSNHTVDTFIFPALGNNHGKKWVKPTHQPTIAPKPIRNMDPNNYKRERQSQHSGIKHGSHKNFLLSRSYNLFVLKWIFVDNYNSELFFFFSFICAYLSNYLVYLIMYCILITSMLS